MKKLLFIAPLLLAMGVLAQTKETRKVLQRHSDGTPAVTEVSPVKVKQDTTKKEIPLPTPNGGQTADYQRERDLLKKPWYCILTYADWAKLVDMLRKSRYPSDEVDNTITFLQNNLHELTPPVADTSKPKK